MEGDSVHLKNLTMDLILANPDLTCAQARGYALLMMKAEYLEDYIWMNSVVQEALYGTKPKSRSCNA